MADPLTELQLIRTASQETSRSADVVEAIIRELVLSRDKALNQLVIERDQAQKVADQRATELAKLQAEYGKVLAAGNAVSAQLSKALSDLGKMTTERDQAIAALLAYESSPEGISDRKKKADIQVALAQAKLDMAKAEADKLK